MRVLISGGGTGGHVFPAIAIADAVKRLRPDAQILFVGARGKLEMTKVPKAGYPIKGLWISGFHRGQILRNLLFPVKLVGSLIQAWTILLRFRPQVVVGVGGYASGPTLDLACRMGIPALIQEQNSYAGVTNKLLGRKVDKVCVAYEGMESWFPAEKLVLTGNPVRDAIRNSRVSRVEGVAHFNLDPAKKTILLVGGSLGARTLNQALMGAADKIAARPDMQVLWQCGGLYEETCQASATAALPNVRLQAFIDRMDLAYAAADVVVSRAGAIAISELCVVGKPVILAPSPNVAEDHQTKNARALESKGAAWMVSDADAGAQLVDKALNLLADQREQERLSEQIKKLARPDADVHIAQEVIRLAEK